jgi:hypothetical protein
LYSNISDSDFSNQSKDFFLLFQTDAQIDFINENPNQNCLLIDATHGTNQYNYKLIIASVLDKSMKSRPLFYCITSTESTELLTKIFEKLKSKSFQKLKVKFFMSDLAPQYYNAFTTCFSQRPSWLYCLWHFKRAAQKNLLLKIKDEEIRVTVREKFNIMVLTAEREDFKRRYREFEIYTKENCVEFHNYFVKYHGKVKERWSLVDRKDSFVNTNMFQESTFKLFKTTYLKRIKRNRLDWLFTKLLKFDIRIVSIQIRLRYTNNIEERGYRYKTMVSSHRKAMDMMDYSVSPLKVGFCINNYRVQIKKPHVCSSDCEIVCRPCGVCFHCVSCSCLAF